LRAQIIYLPIFQMGQLMLGDIQWFTQDPTASEEVSKGMEWNRICLISRLCPQCQEEG
jgi:hypothetical protein